LASLFRYMSAEHAEAFVRGGEVLFRPLSYFRDYEDNGVRADQYEGTLLHRPAEGLVVNNLTTGQRGILPHFFESTVREDDIYVLCFSTERSAELAKRFGAEACVELAEPVGFLARLRGSLALRAKLRVTRLTHGPVRYYFVEEAPIVDWALPDRIALRKPASFEWQREYRFAVPSGNAFAVEQVTLKLVAQGQARRRTVADHPRMLLRLGSLRKISRIHLV
jgi:hypothetical protein